MRTNEILARRCIDLKLTLRQAYYIIMGDYPSTGWLKTLMLMDISEETLRALMKLEWE